MEFRILGPVEARSDSDPVDLGRPKQRALLAALLLRAGAAIPRDALVDALWGEAPPASAVQSLQVYVHGLRKALGAERIETRGTSYRVVLDPGELDLERFEKLVTRATRDLDVGRPDSKSTSSSSSWSARSSRDLSSSKSRIGLGRREARRRASFAKVRASPGVGGPAGPSSRSRSGERLPGSKTSSPMLSQSSSGACPGRRRSGSGSIGRRLRGGSGGASGTSSSSV
jgi:hypothetical protein